MSGDVLVRVDGVSKKFCRDLKRSLWYGLKDTAADLLGRNGVELAAPGRILGGRRGLVRAQARRMPRPHRPQRRGQDDAVEDAEWADQA